MRQQLGFRRVWLQGHALFHTLLHTLQVKATKGQLARSFHLTAPGLASYQACSLPQALFFAYMEKEEGMSSDCTLIYVLKCIYMCDRQLPPLVHGHTVYTSLHCVCVCVCVQNENRGTVPYSGKFSQGVKFRIFHITILDKKFKAYKKSSTYEHVRP